MTRRSLLESVLIGAAALWLVSCSNRDPDVSPVPPAGERTVLYYRDPMHPSYTSPSPGKAPDCGMDLEPVYADASSGRTQPAATRAISVDRDTQRLLGMKLERVVHEPTTGTVRALGRVAADENRVFPVRTGCEGWVRRVFDGASTGSTVKKGELLLRVYGPDFTIAQRSFLYALKAAQNPPPVLSGEDAGQPALTLEEARLHLASLGIGDAQIERLAETRQVMLDVDLVAPAAGVIVRRDVSPQQRFDKDAELLRIADLRSVWIIAELYGDDQASIHPGDTARVTYAGAPGAAMTATVSDALAGFEGGSRALKVRLNADNPRLAMKPDMLVDLEFAVRLPEATTVPSDAVMDAGHGPTVYVATGDGSFEPRSVETGWRFHGRVQIVSGLSAGESIVVTGNALLDSESRMRTGDAGEHD